MRIKNIELKNFKRFTDLTISDIPESSKLVLLIGSNGSGKSSLFDAFDWISTSNNNLEILGKPSYYRKNLDYSQYVKIELFPYFKDNPTIIEKDNNNFKGNLALQEKFIGRSSIRIVPRITNESANTESIKDDFDKPINYIENDTRFINDLLQYIENVSKALREPLFSGKQSKNSEIFEQFIAPLNDSLLNIFGGDEISTIQIADFQGATPFEAAKLIFKKGNSKINYDLLSHGEKQVIILLLNFIVRQEFYKNCIIFIDEMDCHLNTTLQTNLINEIVTRWIPEDSQLWTASHALGFIDYARESVTASTIDFDLLNFDSKQELTPISKDKLEVYEIAIPRATISSILKGYKLVIVENKNDEYFNAALGSEFYLFLPANNNREVFLTVKADKEKQGLRDRDYLKDNEIEEIKMKMPNLSILKLSTFENYIYHPDNFAELNLSNFNKTDYLNDIIKQKNEKLLDKVGEIGTSRNHYIEFKDCIKNDEVIKPISSALKSDDFDTFYPFFNMKKHFNKNILTKYKYSILDLAKSNWFKNEIKKALQR